MRVSRIVVVVVALAIGALVVWRCRDPAAIRLFHAHHAVFDGLATAIIAGSAPLQRPGFPGAGYVVPEPLAQGGVRAVISAGPCVLMQFAAAQPGAPYEMLIFAPTGLANAVGIVAVARDQALASRQLGEQWWYFRER